MFTGIVERRAKTVDIKSGEGGGKRLGFEVEEGDQLPPWETVEIGESIAISGVCLTVVEADGPRIFFDVVPETLSKTHLGNLTTGAHVNIERSLRVGDRFGGHYVWGHIDGTGTILDMLDEGDQILFRITTEKRLINEMITKGSVAVDGVSLTVVEVNREENWFTFAAIPHTLAITSLGTIAKGSTVNLETDAFGKWVLHGMREMGIIAEV